MESKNTAEALKRIMDRGASLKDYALVANANDRESSMAAFMNEFRGFAFGAGDPQISEESLQAYVDGKATDIEREIIESFAEIDDSFARHLEGLRQAKGEVEMSGFKQYGAPQKRSFGASLTAMFKSSSVRWAIEGALTVGAAGVLIAGYVHNQSNGAAPTVSGSGQQVAMLTEKEQSLQAQLDKSEEAAKQIQASLGKAQAAEKSSATAAAQLASANKNLSDRMNSVLATVRSPSALSDLRQPIGATAGEKLTLISPLAKILPDGPVTLQWAPISGAKNYHVLVTELSNEPVVEVDTSSASETVKVPAGATYKWQVKATRQNGITVMGSGGNGVVADFHVMSAAETASLRSDLAAQKDEDGKALVYLQYGMIENARDAIRSFLHSHPQDQVGLAIQKKIESALK